MTTRNCLLNALLAVTVLSLVTCSARAQSYSPQRIAVGEQTEIAKLRIEMRKAELELGAVTADTRGQILNQRVLQDEMKQLRAKLVSTDRDIQAVKSFAVRPIGRNGSKVLALLRTVRVENELAELVNQDVPPIEAEDFEPHLYRGAVESTGELVALPDGLLEFARRKGHSAKLDAMQTQWQALADELVATDVASAPNRQAMHRQLDEVRKVAKAATAPIRAQSNMILDRIQELISGLQHRPECRELAEFLKHHGYVFTGGTVDALLEHVVAYSLVPRQGSVLRLLSKLATAVAQTASDQSLDDRKRLDKLRNNGSFIVPDDEPSRSSRPPAGEAMLPLNDGKEK